MENKKLYSCKDAPSLIDRLTEHMIRKLIKDGILIPIKLGRNVYVTQEAVYKAVFGEDTEPKKPIDTGYSRNRKIFEKGIDK